MSITIFEYWAQQAVWFHVFTSCVAVAWVRFIFLVCYRLFFHPLTAIPGPKLAAATQLYEIYFDVVRGGKYIWEIERMHQQYGPVVRVTPEEVHILDPDSLQDIYAGPSRRRHKHEFHVSNIPNTLIGAELHEDHRRHRAIFSSFFSQSSIRRLEPLISSKTLCLLERIEAEHQLGRNVDMEYASLAWACDNISNICFGQDWQHLKHPNFNKTHADSAFSLLKSLKVLTHAKWITPIVLAIPPWLVQPILPNLAHALYYKPQIKQAVQDMMQESSLHKNKGYSPLSQISIFNHIYHNSLVPESFKTLDQMSKDAELFIGAGEGTVASVLSLTMAYLHLNPRALRRLRRELDATACRLGKQHRHLAHADLRGLPYLTACLQEGIRLQHGFSKRMPRIAPDEDISCHGIVIPRGTPMSTVAPLMHLHAEVFPQPKEYIPERWIDDAQLCILDDTLGDLEDTFLPPRTHTIDYMSSKIMTFSRGSRVCLGMNLAWIELYIGLAALLRAFDLQLVDTDMRHVSIYADKVVPAYHPTKKGLRFKVLERHKVQMKF